MLLKDFLKTVLLLEADCFQSAVIAGAMTIAPPKLHTRTQTHTYIYTLYSAHILTICIKEIFYLFCIYVPYINTHRYIRV